jgi:NAD(P)-dependent dehydrogenase (short-subunit alcohol dehydrogenase family)
MNNRVAVVTGGCTGIGLAIAARLAAHSATVHVLDLQAPSRSWGNANQSGGKVFFHICDVSDKSSVDAAFQEILDAGPIDILVNNAGISHIGNLENTTGEDIDRIFSVNVKGVYNCLQSAIGPMKTHGGGVILNIASVAATAALADRFAYSMSKGAIVAMTYSVARDYLSYNIRCNCVSPARVHTSFVDNYLRKNYPGKEEEMFRKLEKSQPIGRMAEPQEIAALAHFLCSDEATFITGTDYPIDGGFLKLNG